MGSEIGIVAYLLGGVAIIWAFAWMEVARIRGIRDVGLAAIEAEQKVQIAKAQASPTLDGSDAGGEGGTAMHRNRRTVAMSEITETTANGGFFHMAETEKPKERLFSIRSIQGPMAYWAFVQHPYNDPPRLAEAIKAIADQAAEVFDGPDFHRTLWFPSGIAVERWLRATLEVRAQDILTLWNTPRECDAPAISFVSRYGGPPPERDFIDIDALLRNVAIMAWREAADYEREVRSA